MPQPTSIGRPVLTAAERRSGKRRVRSMLKGISDDVANLPAVGLREVYPAIVAAEKEVVSALRTWLETAPAGDERFTAHQYRRILAQLRQARGDVLKRLRRTPGWTKDLERSMHVGLRKGGAMAGQLATNHIKQELATFSTVFGHSLGPIPIQQAVVMARGEKMLIPHYKTSAKRYSGAVWVDLKRQLSIGVVRNETVDQLTNRLVKMGGPKGWVAMRGVVSRTGEALTPGAKAEFISEGLFTRYRHWAERVVRTECLLGGTLVDSAMVTAVHRRWYEGPVVEVVTERGRKLTATPNHPMLTRRAWVGAGSLSQGDYLVCHNGKQDLGAVSDEHVADSPATLGEIFDSLSAIGVAERRCTREPDFHGDGINGYVDILRPLGTLEIGRFAALNKPLAELLFAPSDKRSTAFCVSCGGLRTVDQDSCFCKITERASSFNEPTPNRVVANPKACGNLRDRLALQVSFDDVSCVEVGEQPRVRPQVERLRHGPGDTGIADNAGYPSSADAHLPGNSRTAEPRDVEFDRVLSVTLRIFSGHVYNLSTLHGYFTIAGVYTGNTINAYNVQADEGLKEAHDIDDEIKRRWDASLDSRLCVSCQRLHGEVVDVGEPFPGGVMRPTLHPQCRCAVTAWHASWADDYEEKVALPPDRRIRKEVPTYRDVRGKDPGIKKRLRGPQMPPLERVLGMGNKPIAPTSPERMESIRKVFRGGQERVDAVWPPDQRGVLIAVREDGLFDIVDGRHRMLVAREFPKIKIPITFTEGMQKTRRMK